ncbi:MAG: hypothetical protein AAGD38_22545, partial [Acidobacteriota bacterium]
MARFRLAWLALLALVVTLTTDVPSSSLHDTSLHADDWLAAVAALPPAHDLAVPANGDHWALRVAYPTGRVDPRGPRAAPEHPRRMPTWRPPAAREGAALPVDRFVAIGPQPLEMDGCTQCTPWGRVAGRINAVLSDPSDPSVAYAGSDGGGVWKTTNCCTADTTWEPVTDDPALATIAIGTMAFDPLDSDIVYAGTGDLRWSSWSFGSTGLLRSRNAGETWETLGAEVFAAALPQAPGAFPQNQAIGAVAVDPRTGTLVVGAKTGVYFSPDDGESWIGPCLTNAFADQRQDITSLLVRDRGDATEVIAAVGVRGFGTPVQPDLDQNGANGLYRTTVPEGACPSVWEPLTSGWPEGTTEGEPFPANSVGRIDLARAPTDPDVIYAQVQSVELRGQLGVWRSTDGGTTWEQRSDRFGLGGCVGDWPQNWYNQNLTVAPDDPDTVFIQTVDLFRSQDGGETFINLTCGYADMPRGVHVDHHGIAFVGENRNHLLVGTDGGVYISLNVDANAPGNVFFQQINETLPTLEMYVGDLSRGFAYRPAPAVTAGMQDNGVGVNVFTDGIQAEEWQMTTGADGVVALIEP